MNPKSQAQSLMAAIRWRHPGVINYGSPMSIWTKEMLVAYLAAAAKKESLK